MIANNLKEEKAKVLKLLVDILDRIEELQFLKISDYEVSIEFKKRWEIKLKKFFSNITNYQRNEFPIVVLGRWNSGKSTLINAILGEELLPSANKEMTSILTKVCFGDSKDAIVQFSGGDYEIIQIEEIEEYINFRGSKYSENLKQIDIRFNSSLFKSGLCILDTPGLSSINELNNSITFDVIPKAHAIILTFSGLDVGGEDNLNLIEQIFRLNYDNSYNVVFVITKSDILDKKQIEEAEESLKELISIAQNRVGVIKQSNIPVCIVSSYLELKYQQYQKHVISEIELLNDHKLGLSKVDQLESLHQKSGFENFYKVLNESILNSENKRNITYRLFIMIQSVLTELLEDYNSTYSNILKSNNSSLNQLSALLQKKIDIETKINRIGKEKIKEFINNISVLQPHKNYSEQHINEIINNLYIELCKYIDNTPYEVIAKDKFRELNQQINMISTKLSIDWIKNIKEEFDREWDKIITDIVMIIEKKNKEINDEFEQNDSKKIELEINEIQIETNSTIANHVISIASSASIGAGLFTIGNGLLPGIGGIVGTIAGVFIGYVASRISLSTSEKRKEDLKRNLNKHLLENQYVYRNALEELHLQYEDKIKQLESYLNDSLEKVIHDKESFMKNYDITKIKNEEIEEKLTIDIKSIKDLMPEINLVFSPYIKNTVQ